VRAVADDEIGDWERILLLQHDNESLRGRIKDAEKLHAPQRLHPEFRFAPWCGECSTGIRTFGDDGPSDHIVYWPCATAKALGMVDPLALAAPS
jgi:hypothetical protein